jgi:hypothetical protein
MITAEQNNGSLVITNFYEIDNETAKGIHTDYTGALPPVSAHLKPCAACGKRAAGCCDKSRQCAVSKGELWFQCLYCSKLEVETAPPPPGGADIYFLLDQSGSMTLSDRMEAGRAVKSMMQSLSGAGNTYSLVSWGSSAGYLFCRETGMIKMRASIAAYEAGTPPYGGSTAAHLAFNLIRQDVLSAKRPVRIIFVTDGYFDDDAAALLERNALLAKGNVEILALGVTGANEATLRAIGTVPAFSKVVGDSSALTSTFEQIADALKKSGNNF